MGFLSRSVARIAMVSVAFAAVGCAPAISAAKVEAARIEARVKTALVNDPVIGTRVINVRMLGSVAQLSGRVRSQDEAARAAEVARSVSGVSQVELRLQIGSDPSDEVADTELRADPMRGPAYEVAELEDRPHLLALGAAVGWANQARPSVGARASLQPLVRFGSGSGFGPAIAFEWFDATVVTSPDAPQDAGHVTLRPVMAGVRYSVSIGRVSFSPSLVAGYAFNSMRVPEEGQAVGLPIDVANSFVWRPGLSVWIDTSLRTCVNLSIGRAITSPRITFVESGRLRERAVSADTTVLLVGFAYRLF